MATLNPEIFSPTIDPRDYDARAPYVTRETLKDALTRAPMIKADADAESADVQRANIRETQGVETGGFLRKYDGNALETGSYELRRARVIGADNKVHHNIIVIVHLNEWKRAHVVFYARRYENARAFLSNHFPQTLTGVETKLDCNTPEITLYRTIERVNNRIHGDSAVKRNGYLHQTPAERWYL